MNVNLCVERTLVMDHIAYIWNVKTSGGDVCAHKDGSLGLIASGLNLSDSSLEAVKVLKSLALLHLGVEAEVPDLEEVEQTG